MTKRQKSHSDSELIDALSSEETPSQSSSSGGAPNLRVGKRDELKRATDPDNREPETGSDNPEEDARKGDKTMHAIKKGNAN